MGELRRVSVKVISGMNDEILEMMRGAGFQRLDEGRTMLHYNIDLFDLLDLQIEIEEKGAYLYENWGKYELVKTYPCSQGCCNNLKEGLTCLKEENETTDADRHCRLPE